jgi:hypothetical protein
MFQFLRRWLRYSSRVHVRQAEVQNLRQLVELFDRFLDGPMAYDLEWDDFISWEHTNPNLEQIRNRIGMSERLLFSRDPADRAIYGAIIVDERNKAAAICNIPPR